MRVARNSLYKAALWKKLLNKTDYLLCNAMLAEVHWRPSSLRFVGADRGLNTGFRQLGLESPLQFALCLGIAASARMPLRALIRANKDVFFERGHKTELPFPDAQRDKTY